MDRQARFELHEKRYFHELDAREKIEARLRTPLAMFAIVFGLLAYIANEVPFSRPSDVSIFFWVPYTLGGILFMSSLCCFFRAIYGYHYLLLPTPDTLEQYFNEIVEEYCKTDRGKARQWAAEAFKEYLFDSYVSYSSQNTKNNDSKSLNLNRCIGTLISSFVLSCLSYIPYMSNGLLMVNGGPS